MKHFDWLLSSAQQHNSNLKMKHFDWLLSLLKIVSPSPTLHTLSLYVHIAKIFQLIVSIIHLVYFVITCILDTPGNPGYSGRVEYKAV
jgi:hypothetical protein